VAAKISMRPRDLRFPGAIAQLVEHLLCKQGVRGSSPLSSTHPDLAAKTCRLSRRVSGSASRSSDAKQLRHVRHAPAEPGTHHTKDAPERPHFTHSSTAMITRSLASLTVARKLPVLPVSLGVLRKEALKAGESRLMGSHGITRQRYAVTRSHRISSPM
jgi:hypothetical protein